MSKDNRPNPILSFLAIGLFGGAFFLGLAAWKQGGNLFLGILCFICLLIAGGILSTNGQ